jgi:hypothetical protein
MVLQIYSRIPDFLKVNSITIYPFILISPFFKKYEVARKNVIDHELIHIAQFKETLIIGFYLIYAINYVINLFTYEFNHDLAYRNVAFEREAYKNSLFPNYVKYRKLWAWVKYF